MRKSTGIILLILGIAAGFCIFKFAVAGKSDKHAVADFFQEIKKASNLEYDSTWVNAFPVSYNYNVGVFQYISSQESAGYVTSDLESGKIYPTKFIDAAGTSFSPFMVVAKDRLVARNVDDVGNVEVMLTDLEGNMIKSYKKYKVPENSGNNVGVYGAVEFDGKAHLTIQDHNYELDANYDLVEVAKNPAR
jgi:hypothetical protein